MGLTLKDLGLPFRETAEKLLVPQETILFNSLTETVAMTKVFCDSKPNTFTMFIYPDQSFFAAVSIEEENELYRINNEEYTFSEALQQTILNIDTIENIIIAYYIKTDENSRMVFEFVKK